MIRKLRLKNFQGHKDSVLDFGPGINTITGENDSGKTSIFRSVTWVKDNRPLGTSFIRKNQDGDAIVEIESDNDSISRIRGKKTNEYRISGIEEPFDSFGANPPSDILEALNLEDVNIQSQLEQPFLVLSPPGQVAQHIRSISGLDILDKAVSALKGKITSKNSELSSERKRLSEVEENLSKLQKIDVNKIEKLIQSMESIQKEKDEVSRMISNIRPMIMELEQLEKDRIVLPENLEKMLDSTVEKCEKCTQGFSITRELRTQIGELSELEVELLPKDLFQGFEKTSSRCGDLIDSISKSNQKRENLANLIQELSILKDILELPEKTENLIIETDTLISEYNNTDGEIRSIRNLISELGREDLKPVQPLIEKNQEELFNLLDKIEVCPLCESVNLSKEKKRKILENYK